MYMDRPYKWTAYNSWGLQTLALPRAPEGAKAGPVSLAVKTFLCRALL